MLKSQRTLLVVALSITHYVEASKLQDRSVDLPVAEHVVPIRRLSSSSSQLSGRDELLSSNDIAVSGRTAGLRNTRDIFGVDVQVGDQVSTLIFNTGVPFTLVFAPGFQCLDTDGNKFKPDTCPFTAHDTASFSGGKIDGPILNLTYGDGTGASGPRGYEKVSLAGIHIDRQEIAICNRAVEQDWTTKPVGGFVGFSFPNTDTQQLKANYSYTPWIFTAYEQGLIYPPVFSVALNPVYKRSVDFANNGALAIGGLPPNVPTTGSWAITPVVSDFEDKVIRYWTIIPDGFTVKSKENPRGKFVPWTEQAGYIPGLRRLQVASSIWGINLPKPYVDEIYKSIDPAPYQTKDGSWVANCNASYTDASVRIGGVDLLIDRYSVITSQFGDDLEPGQCFLGVYPGGYSLGANFLRSVLAVHDMTKGKERMLFKQRVLRLLEN
ncbi:aspartic peptidase domain-containing protein [Bipolaris maydis]|nr:hypothetical protein BM1_00534 [Bipolaris maydis]KAJ5064261.1 aspartic peptidase domain-containing protein [Bipolaris maydis]KAJ6196591.1 aspartic peptidase domain-containing protein [Bipolaris maydis]KAJ6269864.1 aspartic peptidase domain-containing protein [Bipolaris maydis]KAJ6280327.1 aspartic peptidase domain-containing protein [Bipolaris maydis]